MAKEAFQQHKSIQLSGSVYHNFFNATQITLGRRNIKKIKIKYRYFLRGASFVHDEKNLVSYKLSMQQFIINVCVIKFLYEAKTSELEF